MSRNAALRKVKPLASAKSIAERVATRDWQRISQDLDAQGSAIIERLLAPNECAAIAALYYKDGIFRSHVVMGRHGFRRDEYKYFSYPLPNLIASIRTAVYPQVVPIRQPLEHRDGYRHPLPREARGLH